ncbi:MAG TPA: hypothetical protein VLA48_02840 [Nitrososphaeraceae archaeon]|nr:hypothetical protein [Nitrososphaeraceae archaeon]
MTITLYLQKETLLRDLQTLQTIFSFTIPEHIDKLRKHYEPLNIFANETTNDSVTIQVTVEEFALIGVFNGGI